MHRSTDRDGDYVRLSPHRIEPPGPYRFLDTSARPGMTYFYRLEAVDLHGVPEFFGPILATLEATVSVAQNQLAQSHPNPFGPRRGPTEIAFELRADVRATLRIFDPTGRLVRVLVDESLVAGPHAVLWDGRDGGGHELSSGIYYYRLDAGQFSETRPLVMLR
jgi:hypothetical protein